MRKQKAREAAYRPLYANGRAPQGEDETASEAPSPRASRSANENKSNKRSAPRDRANGGDGRNLSVKALLDRCTDELKAYNETHGRSEELLLRTLARTLELHRFAQENDAQGAQLSALLKNAGIRTTRTTANPLTPLVKLVFGNPKERSSVGRYAGVLRLAANGNVDPDQLPSFVAEKGGIVACARADSADRLSAAKKRAQSKTVQKLKMLRSLGIEQYPMTLRAKAPDGLFTALFEKGEDGGVKLLGVRATDEKGASGYSPIRDLSGLAAHIRSSDDGGN